MAVEKKEKKEKKKELTAEEKQEKKEKKEKKAATAAAGEKPKKKEKKEKRQFGMKEAAGGADAVAASSTSTTADRTLDLKDLQNKAFRDKEGIDGADGWKYVADDVFAKLFKMSKADFEVVADWKRKKELKKHKLF